LIRRILSCVLKCFACRVDQAKAASGLLGVLEYGAAGLRVWPAGEGETKHSKSKK
jgi:hypothetical protein